MDVEAHSCSLGLWIIVLALVLPGCGRPPTAVAERAASPRIALAPASVTAPAHRAAAAILFTSPSVNQAEAAEAEWLAGAAREDPDPSVRLHALEVWAQRPGTSLDPVTYALVDPDESVRARAQELLEWELAQH